MDASQNTSEIPPEMENLLNKRFLHFKTPEEFYQEMCHLQLMELRKDSSINLDNFFRNSFVRKNPTQQPLPDNYKKMCELQMEEIKDAESPVILPSPGDKRARARPTKTSNFASPQIETTAKTTQTTTATTVALPAPSVKQATPAVPTPGKVTIPPNASLEEEAKNRKKARVAEPEEEKKILMETRKRRKPRQQNDPPDPTRDLFMRFEQELRNPIIWKNKQMRIAVIGAGIAGITAARQLKAIGYDAFVLEGRERIGGRIHTIVSEELKENSGIDIGAGFITGVLENPLTKICQQLSMNLFENEGSCCLYDVDGVKVDPDVESKLHSVFLECMRIADEKKRIRKETNQSDVSLGTILREAVGEYEGKYVKLSPADLRILNWRIATLESVAGGDSSLLSLKEWNQDELFEFMGSSCLIREGYGNVLNCLAQGLDIRLGHRVSKIEYELSASKCKIHTSKGLIEADKILVTLPLGVLKTGSVQFSPELTQEKKGAIRRLGFGSINKLILFFHKIFWDEDAEYIAFSADTKGEFFCFVNMSKIIGSPVLVGLVSGQAATDIEAMTGEEVVTKAMTTLRRIYSNTESPVRAVMTRWGTDPFAMGAYSFVAVGSTGEDYDILAEPLSNRLFFAGEATNRAHPSTTAGAYLSGLRAAREVALSCSGVPFDSRPYHL